MKILRYRDEGNVKPGVLDNDGNIRDLSSHIQDWDHTTITNEKINELINFSHGSPGRYLLNLQLLLKIYLSYFYKIHCWSKFDHKRRQKLVLIKN